MTSPFVGDIIDALFRANTRNAVELEKFLRKRGAARLKALGLTYLRNNTVMKIT
jgi:hypothetical protein